MIQYKVLLLFCILLLAAVLRLLLFFTSPAFLLVFAVLFYNVNFVQYKKVWKMLFMFSVTKWFHLLKNSYPYNLSILDDLICNCLVNEWFLAMWSH